MMTTLETGFFIWNFAAWLKIFVFSSLFLCTIVFLIKKRTGGSLIDTKHVGECRKEEGTPFEQKILNFKRRALNPWFDLPSSHLITMSVIFLLFLVAIFSGTGGR